MLAFNSIKSLWVSIAVCGVVLAAMVLTGCKGISIQGERAAREELKSVGDFFRPQNQRPVLPTFTTNASLSNFLALAILNQPQVDAAYYDWAASIERITRERSLPDPRLTFRSDISDEPTSHNRARFTTWQNSFGVLPSNRQARPCRRFVQRLECHGNTACAFGQRPMAKRSLARSGMPRIPLRRGWQVAVRPASDGLRAQCFRRDERRCGNLFRARTIPRGHQPQNRLRSEAHDKGGLQKASRVACCA